MNYLLFICAHGMPAPDELAVLQREIPGCVDEMNGRGVRLLGRELDLPETAATVRVRDGETLATDGPFAETEEFIAGFDLLECADLDEAIGVAANSPVAWFQAIEVRQCTQRLRLDERVTAFAHQDDSAGRPYLLSTWIGAGAATPSGEHTATAEGAAWRRDPEQRDLGILGTALEAADAARTVRVRDGETRVRDGPPIGTSESIAGIDVVRCADRRQAIELAATHPSARRHAIEMRPFYSE